jgi:hypothetical protein
MYPIKKFSIYVTYFHNSRNSQHFLIGEDYKNGYFELAGCNEIKIVVCTFNIMEYLNNF